MPVMFVYSPDVRGIPNVKAGSKVLLRTTWMSDRDNVIHTVKAITKTGKIRLENGLLFSQLGLRKEPRWGTMVLEEAMQ